MADTVAEPSELRQVGSVEDEIYEDMLITFTVKLAHVVVLQSPSALT